MKNKTINSRIEVLIGRIKSIKSKAESANNLKESGIFQTLESDLQATVVLQKDVETIRNSLKSKTKELEEGISKLKKGSKDAGKILKKEIKPVKLAKEKKTPKEKSPALNKTSGGKKNMVNSKEKPVKIKE